MGLGAVRGGLSARTEGLHPRSGGKPPKGGQRRPCSLLGLAVVTAGRDTSISAGRTLRCIDQRLPSTPGQQGRLAASLLDVNRPLPSCGVNICSFRAVTQRSVPEVDPASRQGGSVGRRQTPRPRPGRGHEAGRPRSAKVRPWAGGEAGPISTHRSPRGQGAAPHSARPLSTHRNTARPGHPPAGCPSEDRGGRGPRE